MRLAFTGDLFLGTHADSDAFREIGAQFESDVRLVVNFEGTLYDRREQLTPARRKILLDSPGCLLPALERLPVALVSTGNNHIGDYGNDVASFTLSRLSERYLVFGAGLEHEAFHRTILRGGDIPIGFVNYCTADTTPLFCSESRIGPRPLDLRNVPADLKHLKAEARHCVAIMHWGEEDFHHPRPAHVCLGRRLIDLGFNVVIGHHPHTAQGFERYKDGWIFYSLGNFCFPDHSVYIDGSRYEVKWMQRRSWGLVPVFNVGASGFNLEKVRIARYTKMGRLRFVETQGLEKKMLRLSRDVSADRYWRRYQSWSGLEKIAIRYEEFLNNERKMSSIRRKLAGLCAFGRRHLSRLLT